MNILRKRKNSLVNDNASKSRRPANTAFKQQRLKSWQPILTPKSVLPLLLVVAVIFAPLGIVMLITSFNVEEFQVNYTNCATLATSDSYSNIPSKYYSFHFKKNMASEPQWKISNKTVEVEGGSYDTTICDIQFNAPNSIKAPIYMYYRLTNFYQNHREYVESFDLQQIRGEAVSLGDLSSDCSPLKSLDNKPIYPCGLIANSVFNDTIGNPVLLNPSGSDSEQPYNLSTTGISWSSDLNTWKKTKYNASDISPPPCWAKRFPNGYTDTNLPDFSADEVFQNWMRTAGLPDFMKLIGINKNDEFTDGNYRIQVEMNYPSSLFGGEKFVILTTNSAIGARNMSLGITYIVVAIVCVAAGIFFLVKQMISPRKIGDNKYLDFHKREVL